MSLLHFSHGLALMLTAGVPTRLSLQTASMLLPAQQAKAITELAEGDLGEGIAAPLGALGIFPLSFRHFLNVGEWSGTLDFTLYKAAQFYHDDLRYTAGLLCKGMPSRNRATLAGGISERLNNGPIPVEITDYEFTFYTEALRDMGVTDEVETPQSGRQRMIVLTRRFLRYAWHRNATAVEVRHEDHQIRLCIDNTWQQTRPMPSWMYDMLCYRLREMAGLDTSNIFRPDAGEIALTIAGETRTIHFVYRPRMNGGMIEIKFRR